MLYKVVWFAYIILTSPSLMYSLWFAPQITRLQEQWVPFYSSSVSLFFLFFRHALYPYPSTVIPFITSFNRDKFQHRCFYSRKVPFLHYIYYTFTLLITPISTIVSLLFIFQKIIFTWNQSERDRWGDTELFFHPLSNSDAQQVGLGQAKVKAKSQESSLCDKHWQQGLPSHHLLLPRPIIKN